MMELINLICASLGHVHRSEEWPDVISLRCLRCSALYKPKKKPEIAL